MARQGRNLEPWADTDLARKAHRHSRSSRVSCLRRRVHRPSGRHPDPPARRSRPGLIASAPLGITRLVGTATRSQTNDCGQRLTVGLTAARECTDGVHVRSKETARRQFKPVGRPRGRHVRSGGLEQSLHVWPAIRDFHEGHSTDFDPLLSDDRASQRFVEPARRRRIVNINALRRWLPPSWPPFP